MTKVKAFPIYRMRRRGPEEGVEAVEHPDTGKWWFRRIQRRNYQRHGQYFYGWGPWECPENQPDEPYKGMRRREGAFAMLPA